MGNLSPRTTVGLKKTTKARLDGNRAPGQSYDGFLSQMVELWEEVAERNGYLGAGPAGGNQGAGVSFFHPGLNR
jgi:hypothetical protein